MEMMIWNMILTGLFGVLAFVVKDKFSEIQRLNILLNRTREEVARDHITRSEVRADVAQLLERLDRLEQKIDRLAQTRRSEEH